MTFSYISHLQKNNLTAEQLPEKTQLLITEIQNINATKQQLEETLQDASDEERQDVVNSIADVKGILQRADANICKKIDIFIARKNNVAKMQAKRKESIDAKKQQTAQTNVNVPQPTPAKVIDIQQQQKQEQQPPQPETKPEQKPQQTTQQMQQQTQQTQKAKSKTSAWTIVGWVAATATAGVCLWLGLPLITGKKR